jgi:DNA-binding NarL/FixJ family response regulator
MENSSVRVTVLGPSLLREAMETLLRALPPDVVTATPYVASPPDAPRLSLVVETPAGNKVREVPPRARSQAHVVLLVGPDWQERVAAERRAYPRSILTTPEPRYALVTGERTVDFASARRHAVTAFIGDDEPPEVLAQGIASAAAGRSFCSPQLLPALIDAVGNGVPSSPGEEDEEEAEPPPGAEAHLSSREHEVTLHAARGLSNEQISVYMKISVPTVKYHLQRAFRKLGVERRTQLAVFLPYLTEASQALLGPAPGTDVSGDA